MSLATWLHPAPWEQKQRDWVQAELETISYPATTTRHTSRQWHQTCDVQSAPWCTGIHKGEQYAVLAFPPASMPFRSKKWLRVKECKACGDYCCRIP